MNNMNQSEFKKIPDDSRLDDLYQALSEYYEFEKGWPEGNWPITGRFNPPGFEVIVGAILTQNTRWENVETALAMMVEKGLTTAEAVLSAPADLLENAIRSSGFFRQKSAALTGVCRLWKQGRGVPPPGISRSELLKLDRIGPETADSILLYALDRTEFIADAYTRRLVFRLGSFPPPFSYQAVKDLFEEALPPRLDYYRRFHALIVQHGKRHCRSKPLCRGCPLRIRGICRFSEKR